ncbi:MAG: PIN domain-containing protein [Candidatus Methanomethylicaceae archaeon]
MDMCSRTATKETVPVLLDTNILLYSVSEPFEIKSQIEKIGFKKIVITEGVKRELERIANSGRTKEKKFAKLSLEIANRFEVLPDPLIGGTVDDQLLYLSKNYGYIVATSDALLRKRLRKEGLPVIFIKNKRLIAESSVVSRINPKTSTF